MQDNINPTQLLIAIRSGEMPSERSEAYWTEEERNELKRLYWAGTGISEMALLLQRSENAVFQQLIALGLTGASAKRSQRFPKPQKCQCPCCKELACSHCGKGGICNAGGV